MSAWLYTDPYISPTTGGLAVPHAAQGCQVCGFLAQLGGSLLRWREESSRGSVNSLTSIFFPLIIIYTSVSLMHRTYTEPVIKLWAALARFFGEFWDGMSMATVAAARHPSPARSLLSLRSCHAALSHQIYCIIFCRLKCAPFHVWCFFGTAIVSSGAQQNNTYIMKSRTETVAKAKTLWGEGNSFLACYCHIVFSPHHFCFPLLWCMLYVFYAIQHALE